MQGWLFSSYLCLGSLLALLGFNQFVLAPADSRLLDGIFFIVQILPLVLPLPGLLSGSIRSTFLLCLASLLYFIHGVLLCFDGDRVWLGSAEITFALGLCAATAFLVRKLREAQAASDG